MKMAWMALLMTTVATSAVTATGQELSQRDQLKAAIQQICPVSGQQLGAHGVPVKARVGDEEVFLCCEGCLRGEINVEHWATIHARFAAAQVICPVMEHDLPRNPGWTIVGGSIIYICCPPCTEKIEEDPERYLRKLDELYAAALRSGEFRR